MKATVYRWAIELGLDKATLQKRFSESGLHVVRGAQFTTKQAFRAAMGDLESERVLETRERRKNLELDRLQKEQRLVDLAEAGKLFSDLLFPVRQWMLALPASACSRCNPADPQLAREALQRIVDDALPMLRQHLPKSKAVKEEEVSQEHKLKLG